MAILPTAAVANDQTEKKAQELLYSFYNYYFSGNPLTLAGQTVTFPKIEDPAALVDGKSRYLFNQSQPALFGTGPQIHTIFTDLRPLSMGRSATAKTVKGNAIITIYVRVANPSTGMNSAAFESRYWADALKQIFQSGNQALAQLGIHKAKVARGPVPVATPAQQTNMLVITAQFQYDVGY